MADQCVSVGFGDGKTWVYCWDYTSPAASWQAVDVTTGLRRGYSATAKPWRTCQYFVKGMPSVCSFWREGDGSNETIASGTWACHYRIDNESINPLDPAPAYPTGFNSTQCDFLGRRSWCDKYNASVEFDPEKYACAAPNPYLTGLGKRDSATGLRRPIAKKDIRGYNENTDDGSGRCDCYGMGRGPKGCAKFGEDILSGEFDATEIEKELQKLPRFCNYYRPWQMGFGSIQPQSLETEHIGDDKIIRRLPTDGEKEDAYAQLDTELERRLPIQFKFYNLRSQFQKCQWWDKDEGSKYILHEGTQSVILEEEASGDPFESDGKITFCKCTDTTSRPYNHRVLSDDIEEYAPGQMFVGNVIAGFKKEDGTYEFPGGYVCNGARPECPCYSGKWIYLTEEKMLPGMPLTANQILELRFWAANWETQEQYNEYFLRKPNFNDPRSASIFTFKKWLKKTGIATESRMEGRELTLCQPTPLFNREFIPELYITSNTVEYAATFGITSAGTSSSSERYFATLIRDPDFPYVLPLEIIYPYYNDEVFDPEVCKKQTSAGHIKRHNSIYGDSISIVGFTLRNKNIYAINLNFVDIGALIKSSATTTAFSLKDNQREQAYSEIEAALYLAFEKYPDYIVTGQSDKKLGDFVLDPIKLEYGRTNKLLICVDLGNGTWEFRKRSVISKWYGGMLYQTQYTHTYPSGASLGYLNEQPLYINPSATAKLSMVPMGSADNSASVFNELFDVHRNEIASISTPIVEYAYSIIKTHITKTSQLDSETGEMTEILWGAVGNSNKVWVEIDDLNLNYIYNWEIKSAVMNPIVEEGKDIPIRETAVATNMQVKDIDRNTIPPNAVLLEPTSDIRVRFSNKEWTLTIEYEYEELTNQNVRSITGFDLDRVVYGANSGTYDRYVNTSYSINKDGNNINIGNIVNDTVALLAYFVDENARLISTVATKVCVEIVSERCRSVDIFYSYKATGKGYALQPETGFCIDVKGNLALEEPRIHVETPDCGDHDMSGYVWEGPMWYPFNACRGYDMYDEFTICNNCQAGYVGPINEGVARDAGGNPILIAGQVLKRNDYRYCGPYKYDAWGAVRGNWASACDCGCKFYFSDASNATPVFIGYGRIREPIDLGSHRGVPPPFGNDGRNLIERFISHDHTHHFLVNSIVTRSEWEPIMMDNTAFFMSFNAFDKPTDVEDVSYSYVNEYFHFTNQLNFKLLNNIEETIDDSTRYRFDDLFEVHFKGNCTYPPPALPTFVGNATYVNYYSFKVADASWAWQEYWKDIERNLDTDLPSSLLNEEDNDKSSATGKLEFIELERPKYVFSLYKQEHRLIAGEGEHYLIYRGPKIDEESGELVKYPTISLDGAHPRSFEIFYTNYTDSQVDWQKEGGESNVDGSSDVDNIYEEADSTRGDWLHSPNTLFDAEAVSGTEAAAAVGRDVVVARDDFGEQHKYYNRGIIANIKKDRLDYLPKSEEELSFSAESDEVFSFESANKSITISGTSKVSNEERFQNLLIGLYVWSDSQVNLPAGELINSEDPENTSTETYSIAKLIINGNWGTSKGKKGTINKYVKPGVSLSLTFDDDTTGSPRGFSSPNVVAPTTNQDMEEYTIELKFLLGPNEMIKNKTKAFSIILDGLANNYISIDSMYLYLAEYIDVQIETIKLWERKYKISKASKGQDQINLDGPGDNLSYNLDLTNGGVYYPFKGARAINNPDETIVAYDKMRSAYAATYHRNVEYLDISYDNLHDIELEEQQFHYKEAYNMDTSSDILNWSFILPIKIYDFFDNFNFYNYRPRAGSAVFLSAKLSWELHQRVKQFKQYAYWRPGGHQYAWSTRVTFQNCFIFGSPEQTHSGYYIHVDHYGIGTPLEIDPSKPIDPGNSYYSLRFYTQVAKYNRFLILSGLEPEGGTDLVTSANLYNLPL